MMMETYKLSRKAARAVARYLSTYHTADDDSSAVACGLWALTDDVYDAIVIVDDEPEAVA